MENVGKYKKNSSLTPPLLIVWNMCHHQNGNQSLALMLHELDGPAARAGAGEGFALGNVAAFGNRARGLTVYRLPPQTSWAPNKTCTKTHSTMGCFF